MKKKVVIGAVGDLYGVDLSPIGSIKPKNHPYSSNCIIAPFHGLKIGDILRCDGFPFMSRPKPLYTNKPIKYNDEVNTRFEDVITHKPVQLPTSLWVLRPIENI